MRRVPMLSTRWGRCVVDAPWPLAVFLLLLALTTLQPLIDWSARTLALTVDPSIRALLPASGPELATFEQVRERYHSDDLLLVTWVGDDLFTPPRLAALKRLSRRLQQLPGVADVESLATALQIRVFEDYSDVSPFLAEIPATVADAHALRDAVLANPLYAGYLVSADGRGAVLAVRFDPALSARQLIPIVADIAAASAAEADGIDEFLSGPLFVRLEISRLLLRDLLRVMPLAILATLLVVAVGFRTLRGILLPLLANGLALAATLAAFVLAGNTLNYVTVILPPTIYVVGFAYAIHVISDFEHHYSRCGDRRQAVLAALEDVAAPVSLTALTTAFGFASLGLSDIDSIRMFGIYASIGTMAAWAAALSVVPVGLMLLPGRPRSGRRPLPGVPLAQRLALLARRRGGLMLLAGLALTVAAVGAASRIEVGTDYLENFAEDSPVRNNFMRLNEVFAGAVPLQILLESETVDAFMTPAALREVAALKRWLLAQPEVGGVYTLLDYIGVLERALAPDLVDADPVPESAGLTNHLILLGASDDLNRFAEPGFSSTLMQVRVRVVASADLNALTARIKQRLQQLPGGLRGQVSGSSHMVARTLDAVTRGQVLSLAAALIPIYLVLTLLFRSLSLAAIALIPNALPLLVFFGVLGICGIPLNLTTSLVASVVLGIAVDDSIHFFARLGAIAQREVDNGAALGAAIGAVLRPVTFTTAGLVLGFMTLAVGELRSQAEFGALAAVTLGVAWLLDLSFTPALAHRFGVAAAARRTRD